VKRLLFAAMLILWVTVYAAAGSFSETGGHTGVIAPTDRIEVRFKDDRLFLDIVEADLAEVLRAIAKKTGIYLTLGEGITGRVSIQMAEATVEEALKTLCRSLALVYEYLPDNKSYRIIQAAAVAETADKSGRIKRTARRGR